MIRISIFKTFNVTRAFAPAIGVLLAFVLFTLPAAAKDSGFTHGLLWRVEVAGVAPSYVFGTMHSADPAIATPPAALQRLLQSVASLTIEVILDEPANMEMAGAMMMPEGQLLGDIAGPERMQRVVATGAHYGIPGELTQRFRPWALQLMFSLPPSEMQRQGAGEKSLDLIMEARARARGIPVYGLEVAGEQIAALSGSPVEEQLVLLDAAITMNPDTESIFAELKAVYLAGDLAKMNRMMQDLTGGAPQDLVDAYNDRLVHQRNIRMADRMAARLEEGNALIAVGALHLYGENGVPGLLAKRGYRVTRVD